VVAADGDSLMIRLHDQTSAPYTQPVDYQYTLGSGDPTPGTSPDGWITIQLPDDSCPSSVHVEWGPKTPDGVFFFAEDIVVACDAGDDTTLAKSRLDNLGYDVTSDDAYQDSVIQFQADYGLSDYGLDGGQLPSATQAKLAALFGDDCDASRGEPTS
jgi:hypothetical protein